MEIDGETMETVTDFIFLGSKITADGDCSHKIKRQLLLWRKAMINLRSLQFSCSVVSHSLRPHEPQHARPPCPSSTPRVHTNPCPLCRWCHPTISCSVVPFSSCPQSFPASSLFKWVSSLHQVAKVLEFQLPPLNTQDWSPVGWTGWISLQSKGLSRVSTTTVQKHQFFSTQLSL